MRCEKREKKWERMKKIWRVDFYIKWEFKVTNTGYGEVLIFSSGNVTIN